MKQVGEQLHVLLASLVVAVVVVALISFWWVVDVVVVVVGCQLLLPDALLTLNPPGLESIQWVGDQLHVLLSPLVVAMVVALISFW